MSQYIKISRKPYEEPYILNLIIEASNETTKSELEYYCNIEDLNTIGENLTKFPQKTPDDYIYSIGSEKEEDRNAYYFYLKAYTLDLIGNCAIQLKMNNNRKCPNENNCIFTIITKVADINRLGHLLLGFSKMYHTELHWYITSGELI